MRSKQVGYLLVKEDKKDKYYGIYDLYTRKMITHKTSWSSALRLAKIIYKTYMIGRKDGIKECEEFFEQVYDDGYDYE